MKAMQALLETDAPAALILEDDAEVGASVPAIIQSVEWWPKGHGLVKLESPYRSRSRLIVRDSIGATPDGRALHPIVRKHVCAFGYLVDRATAGRVTALRDPCRWCQARSGTRRRKRTAPSLPRWGGMAFNKGFSGPEGRGHQIGSLTWATSWHPASLSGAERQSASTCRLKADTAGRAGTSHSKS